MSEEIIVVVSDLANPSTPQWAGGRVQKIVSVAAANATAKYMSVFRTELFTIFDPRVHTPAVASCFAFRWSARRSAPPGQKMRGHGPSSGSAPYKGAWVWHLALLHKVAPAWKLFISCRAQEGVTLMMMMMMMSDTHTTEDPVVVYDTMREAATRLIARC